eukprot:TRINITY_DN24990_c1_g2_i1.p1 TRINITY_DN24990_c1_g2~~TRINITY_DN24990_c1_g2_i1.p1  ORF type:complete len:359 (-),score=94.54 TRINITY_DN24990_c1_g2_i1:74-1150(-)
MASESIQPQTQGLGLGIFDASTSLAKITPLLGEAPAASMAASAQLASNNKKEKKPKNNGGPSDGNKKSKNHDDHTTVMLRNIPNKYSRKLLIDQLHALGFKGDIDYMYLPTDFSNQCNVGYCFCNFRTPAARMRFTQLFDGKPAQTCLPGYNSHKVCQVTKAKWQGRSENVRRLKSSPELMVQLAAHPEWLPLLLNEAGEQEPFTLDRYARKVQEKQAKKRGGKGGQDGDKNMLATLNAMPGMESQVMLQMQQMQYLQNMQRMQQMQQQLQMQQQMQQMQQMQQWQMSQYLQNPSFDEGSSQSYFNGIMDGMGALAGGYDGAEAGDYGQWPMGVGAWSGDAAGMLYEDDEEGSEDDEE